MDKILLLSEATLKATTVISDNIDGKYIMPTIVQVQETDLDNITGTVLREKLEQLVSTGAISTNQTYKNLLDKYVVPYMANQVAAALMIPVTYKVSNSGVIQNQDDKKNAVSMTDLTAARTRFENVASAYATKLRDHLCANAHLYPEYKQMKDFQRASDPQICGIVFD